MNPSIYANNQFHLKKQMSMNSNKSMNSRSKKIHHPKDIPSTIQAFSSNPPIQDTLSLNDLLNFVKSRNE